MAATQLIVDDRLYIYTKCCLDDFSAFCQGLNAVVDVKLRLKTRFVSHQDAEKIALGDSICDRNLV